MLGAVLGAVLLAVALVVLLLGAPVGGAAQDDFVTRDTTMLQVDGQPFRFVGFNLYDAAASDVYSCTPATRLDDAGLDQAMQAIHDAGGTVVRFWAFPSYTSSGTDFSGVDRAIDAAREHDLRVLPVLEDGPGDCSTGEPGVPLDQVDGGRWYVDGYRQPLGTATVSFRDYVATITRHYRDDPTIMGWSLVNEAETPLRDDQGRSVLVDFARDVATVAQSADPHHLVTLGTQSNGAIGASGADFTAIYSLPQLDLTEVHDWATYGDDDEAMPGSVDGALPDPDQCQATDAPVACSFTLARQLDKPIVVGEAGIGATDQESRTRRAEQLDAKMDAAFEAGASGYLLWQLNDTNTDGYAIGTTGSDPVYSALRDVAQRWGAGPGDGPP